MDDEKLRSQIGANIASRRKQAGLTQAGLAEKLNYSDKAISKWERGESIPDVVTLIQLAQLFRVTVNDLLAAPGQQPEQGMPLQQDTEKTVEISVKRKANKNIILSLSSVLVWFVALLVFVMLSSFGIPHAWLPFAYAIPANAIVLLSLRCAWHEYRWNRELISAIVWGALLSVHLTLLTLFHFNMWKLYLLGIPGQAAIFLWFRLFTPARKKENADG